MVSGIQDVKQKNMDTGSDNLSNQFSSEQLLKADSQDQLLKDSLQKFHEITSSRHLDLNTILRDYFSKDRSLDQFNSPKLQSVNNFFNNKNFQL